jgi:hypothetical protein
MPEYIIYAIDRITKLIAIVKEEINEGRTDLNIDLIPSENR